MKFVKKKLLQALLCLVTGVASSFAFAVEQLSYQGYIETSAGEPFTGMMSITFSIPGTDWTENYASVSVENGLFNISLGSKNSLEDVDFSEQRSLKIDYNGTSHTVPLLVPEQSQENPFGELNCTEGQTIKFINGKPDCDPNEDDSGDSEDNGGGSGNTGGSGGSVFIHWGSPTAPAGATLLGSGIGFSSYHNHNAGGVNPLCIEEGDIGAPGPGRYYGDLLYPIMTGSYRRMPPGITAKTVMQCAIIYVPGPSFERWGTHTCPDNWSAAYKGYAMSTYYTGNRPATRICVDNTEFDYSIVRQSKRRHSVFYGSVLYGSSSNSYGDYVKGRYIKCAVCVKD